MRIKSLYTSSFKKWVPLVSSLCYIVGLVLLLLFTQSWFNSILVSPNPPNHQDVKIASIIKRKVDPEIAIFGSSVAYLHYNPKVITDITQKTSYNFGLEGTALIQYKGLLNEYLEYSKSEVIILSGTYTEFSNREEIYEFDKYAPYLDRSNIYNALFDIDPALTWKMKYLPFYDFVYFNNEYRKILIGQHYVSDFVSNDYNGFESHNFGWMEKDWMSADALPPVAQISEESLKSYNEVISEATKKGKKVVLVLAPIFIEGQAQIKNLDEVRFAYQSLTGENVHFLDFSRHSISKNKNYFYNYTHLNTKGANKFSEEFSKSLKRLKF
jgi:hypothetical protein